MSATGGEVLQRLTEDCFSATTSPTRSESKPQRCQREKVLSSTSLGFGSGPNPRNYLKKMWGTDSRSQLLFLIWFRVLGRLVLNLPSEDQLIASTGWISEVLVDVTQQLYLKDQDRE